jgi:hypothetical protein
MASFLWSEFESRISEILIIRARKLEVWTIRAERKLLGGSWW